MKKILFVAVLCLFASLVSAEGGRYPWVLTGYGGGANSCIANEGCMEIVGPAVGASFGRQMSDRWSFELDGFWTSGSRILPATVDPYTGIIYSPEDKRTRIYGGAMFLCRIAQLTSTMDMFIVLGGVGGYERQEWITPPEVFHGPPIDNGIKGGFAAGAGFNWWFSENWGLRPEFRLYPVFDNLTGFRYTAGIMHKF